MSLPNHSPKSSLAISVIKSCLKAQLKAFFYLFAFVLLRQILHRTRHVSPTPCESLWPRLVVIVNAMQPVHLVAISPSS